MWLPNTFSVRAFARRRGGVKLRTIIPPRILGEWTKGKQNLQRPKITVILPNKFSVMDAAAITRLCEAQRRSETENYRSPEKMARISGEWNQSTGRKDVITDLVEFSRKDDSWNHLERPRLPASIIFCQRCGSARAALRRWTEKREFNGKLKQGYDIKWLLQPFLIGVNVVGAGGCWIRKRMLLQITEHFWTGLRKNPRGTRPGSELQFFPWISENRSTNLVIKRMIKSF